MRLTGALLHAIRARRTQRTGPDQAGRRAADDLPGPDHQGLAELLAAAKAPATAEELAGERAAVAGFAAARRRAAVSPRRRSRVRMSRATRGVVVNVAAGLVLVGGTGTAVAARSGHLPDGAQQHAHRLFSALGVPAPRTVRDEPSAVPEARPSGTTSRPAPAPTPGVSATRSTEEVAAGWCRAWVAAPHESNARRRRDLIAAAGGEEKIPAYCAGLGVTASPSPGTTSPQAGTTSPAGTPKPAKSDKPDHTRKPHPTHPSKAN